MSRKVITTTVVLTLILILASSFVFAGHQITITIDGLMAVSDVAPRIDQGRTLVPIRVISEHFGADVEWVQETMTVEIITPYTRFIEDYSEKKMYIMEADDVLALVKADSAVVLDVRSDELRGISYITDSMHIPIVQLLERIDELPEDQAIAVYCAKNINASYAVAILNMMGYEAYLLENGMQAWEDAGGDNTLCRK